MGLLDEKELSKDQLDRFCGIYTPPSPTDWNEMLKENSKIEEFLNQAENMSFLLYLYRVCSFCEYREGNESEHLCNCSGCHAEYMGVCSVSLSYNKMLYGKLCKYLLNMLDRSSQKKVGRKSRFNERAAYYEVYYKDAAKKPSLRQLGAKIGVSHMTVQRDLEKLGYLEKQECNKIEN